MRSIAAFGRYLISGPALKGAVPGVLAQARAGVCGSWLSRPHCSSASITETDKLLLFWNQWQRFKLVSWQSCYLLSKH